MRRTDRLTWPHDGRRDRREGGQILVIGVFLILGLIAMAALVLEGGNAFAQQRATQNGTDAAANAGAVVLAERLKGVAKTDADVAAAVNAMVVANGLSGYTGVYTDVQGRTVDAAGALTSTSGNPPAPVGGGTIPPGAQGVAVRSTKTFGTTIGRAVGLNTFDASADATAVTGRLVGGPFIPVIFPVSITDCDGNGTLPPFGKDQWETSDPPTTPGGYPDGQEYIIPLCKTFGSGGGSGASFQVLDLDPDMTCEEEAATPPRIEWTTFPVWVDLDNGNNCAKPIADVVNAEHRLEPILIPICDTGSGAGVGCESQAHGSKGQYHVSGVVAFYVDWMYDKNGGNDPHCEEAVSSTSGQPLQNVIGGNGSSSCVQGWFIEFITTGPVGSGPVGNAESIGVQLIR
ncbi:MAG TPA: Tad domain-containing protein [Candidatus Limnocylindrales bacterium]|nr:Tad domain-containing protein [Candidatus Limnocylindrales bacterium]